MAVTAVVLAAGLSSRFVDAGLHKLVALVDGTPLVRLSVRAALDARIGDVVVVTGAGAAAVEQALAGLDVRLVHEPAFAEGMAMSLRRGVGALASETEAVVIALGDQPFVRPEAYRRVVQTWRDTTASFVVPRYAGHLGRAHRVLLSAAVFDELLALRGDVGARQVIARDPGRVAVATLEWDSPMDVDTRADLARLADERRPRD